MRFETLSQWLDWQSALHPTAINLGLDRVAAAAANLTPRPETTRVITVGGTNGKGSCVRYLESILQAAGYRVGAYTSPHLERYNERVRINGAEADDAALCAAFERVDQARNDIRLTYFEFGTLAALDVFWREQLDVVVLEVGLGGRLDAVNIVDADCAIVTNIALDHMEWLGPDRESIGREKAGIYRAARPAICADRDPPASLLAQAKATGADLRLIGRDFDWDAEEKSWHFSGGQAGWRSLPYPPMPGVQQLDDASAALAALEATSEALPITAEAARTGIAAAKLPGRFETLPGEPATILDVAHNPAAARALATSLQSTRGAGRTLAVLGMLRDKAADEVAAALAPQVDYWYLAGLGGPRGLDAAALQGRTAETTAANSSLAGSPWQAWQQANAAAQAGDRIVVCGSFLTVAEVRERWHARRGRAAVD
ncbi:MAG TPA: bifunctional tetrahydrofolate synthase/dihydrofolate synthase [Gammaproteobacteria bacterium]|nr:bifunctional tetrahydrofolate synthase/dihydrofolate synthase [Gammaproteobacteria bacterium]